VTKNGIDLETVDRNIERDEDGKIIKDKNKLIYISRPERGLAPLLKIFDKMLQSRPHLQLKVARYYSMYEPNPDVKRICDEADKAMESMDNVEYLGNLGKRKPVKPRSSVQLKVG
jgi:glycosyltransferase involved in cell wall biosynthesis